MTESTDLPPELADFDRTTSRWGRLTMLCGLIISLAGPLYLVFFTGLDISAGQLWTAFLGVAAVFAIIWLVEPVTYFPILGPAAMYQAFMIGNISSKLLPSALVAQNRIGAKPGTRRAELRRRRRHLRRRRGAPGLAGGVRRRCWAPG